MSHNLIWTMLTSRYENRVALITGGSSGIGAQLGRVLALSGARVLLASRNLAQLNITRDGIVAELCQAGYNDAEARVHVEANCDVGQPQDMDRLVERALATFGRVDILINNAGIVGPEDMVIDMPIDGWRSSLEANMISNYRLIRKLAPQMKQNGEGYVLNVSSFFGGERYVAIAYPNRADYAVGKAGQRAIAEALARFLGPEIQINTIAPGPVDGDRLRGTAERPSMFDRRARVILENKRLNSVYTALIAIHRSGTAITDVLPLVLANNVRALLDSPSTPEPLRRVATNAWEHGDPAGASRAHLLSLPLARKLVKRLIGAGVLSRDEVRVGETVAVQRVPFVAPPDPFFTKDEFRREGGRVGDRIMGALHLHRAPTNLDVALSALFYMADRTVTGHTFHPSGGLRMERAVPEGELFGKADPERLSRLRGCNVYLVGDHMRHHLLRLTRAFLDECGVARVVLLTEHDATAHALLEQLPLDAADGRVVALATHGEIERGFERTRAEYGEPGPVVSTPFRPLPECSLSASASGDWSQVLSEEGFAELVEQQLTHHVRVTQSASLIDGAQVVLVTPATGAGSSVEHFALANFVKTTLHSFTATVGAESERTVHHVAVNQIDLTRRTCDEEPGNAVEEAEELERFVDAVLLTSAPLVSPQESRYQARIHRGNAITV